MTEAIVCRAGDELSASEIHGVWMIRDAVFSVEQNCRVPDPDGIDLLPTCHHLWIDDESGPRAYLRSYVDGAGLRHIGRVCTRADARSQGLAGLLIDEAHRRWGEEPIVISAQAHLRQWYERRGYVVTGPMYIEAAIDHLPMRREACEPS